MVIIPMLQAEMFQHLNCLLTQKYHQKDYYKQLFKLFQHLSYDYKGLKGNYDDIFFDKYLRVYLGWLEDETGIDVSNLGTGARNGERINKKINYY